MTVDFWKQRWANGEIGWDLRQASPPLTAYCDQIPLEKRHFSVLIPGCGNGYEALHLLAQGFTDITMLDIVPAAVENMRQRLDAAMPDWATKIQLVCGDFFALEGQFDLILEQTFFCAIDPVRRGEYAQQMHRLLKPNGKLVGVMFDRSFEGGPPFGGSQAEYRALFDPLFSIKTMEKCHNSIAPRAGTEVFVALERR